MGSFGLINAFLEGSIVSKVVFILLILLSIYSWSIILNKIVMIRKVKIQIQDFIKLIDLGTLKDTKLYIDSYNNEYSELLERLMIKYNSSDLAVDKETIEYTCDSLSYPVVQKLENQMSVLATISNSSPFIGLFGTVVGVINAFTKIATTSSASLSVIAPGIAEALYATALGLLVAVPASVAYNILTNKINSIEDAHDLIVSKLILKVGIK